MTTEPISALYSREILRHTATISRIGRLEQPDASASAVSRMCGSKITVDLKLDGDQIVDFAQDVEACALGQCAASIVAKTIVGTSIDELREVRQTMYAMLKENGPVPDGKWADLKTLESVRDYPARHGSVMLVFNAIDEALKLIGR
jgi:NifU-like protein involved in Fe-S cluster formation